jgi:XapX domain-containing protein
MNDLLIAISLGLGIGAACRWFDLPLPAPPKLVGALLVVAMTLGFIGADQALQGLP